MRLDDYFLVEREGQLVFAVPVVRALLRDSRLSFGARGLFYVLWDYPANWRIRLSHLSSEHIGPQRKTAVRSLLRELEAVDALRIVFLRRDVSGCDPETGKSFKKGQIYGKKWILRSPELWAVESPLGVETYQNPIFKSSAKPNIENASAKTDKQDLSTSSRLKISEAGIFCWTPEDYKNALLISESYSTKEIESAISKLDEKNLDPFPGRILNILTISKHGKIKRSKHQQSSLFKNEKPRASDALIKFKAAVSASGLSIKDQSSKS